MRTQFETVLKKYFYEQQAKTRSELCLTQAKMASRLNMELRSYSDLDKGVSGCSALTLASYLIYCCDDPMRFLSGLYEAFKPLTDTLPRNLLLDTLNDSLSYRQEQQVTEIFVTKDGERFPVCPRCKITMEREYMRCCDRCGQKLGWDNFSKAVIIYAVHNRVK